MNELRSMALEWNAVGGTMRRFAPTTSTSRQGLDFTQRPTVQSAAKFPCCLGVRPCAVRLSGWRPAPPGAAVGLRLGSRPAPRFSR